MQYIRAISLDLDDTLWALGPAIERAEQAAHAWFARHYPQVVARFSIEDMRAMRRRVVADFPGREHDLPLLRRAAFNRLAREAGYSDDPGEAAFAAFQQVRNQVTPFADVGPALERLARRVPLVALTNGTADLAAIGLRAYFTAVVTAVDIGAAKPDRRAFHGACERLGIEPGYVAHAGDDPHLDVAGARAAGLHAVWVNRAGHPWPDGLEPAAHVVADLGALADLLGA
ncbi:MAG: HAD family hydrolase [Gammaproteobacteria bacterium]|nr:HAD family hydrolase [Gammaproteobacteria bacterium]